MSLKDPFEFWEDPDVVEDYAFQFPIHQFMNMISPRYLKDSTDRTNNHSLDDFTYFIDFPFFDEAVDYGYSECCSHTRLQWHSWATLPTCMWPAGSDRDLYHEPIADLLNTLVEIGHNALDAVGVPLAREDRFYSHLTFIVYCYRQTGDYLSRSSHSRLEPRIVGGNDISEHERQDVTCWWGAPQIKKNDPSAPHANIEVVVVVEESWSSLVADGIKYAKCQFMAHPSRTFVLMLGFNYSEDTMRFLLFHRSGLTATEDINLREHDGCKDFLRVMMTILLWSEQHDAGFPECSNDVEFFLADKLGVSTWTITDTIHASKKFILGPAPFVHLVRSAGIMTGLGEESKGRLRGRCDHEDTAAETDRSQSLSGDNAKNALIHPFESRGRRGGVYFRGHMPRHYLPILLIALSSIPPGYMLLIKESWQPLDRVNLEEDMSVVAEESGVQLTVGGIMEVEYNNGEAQSTSIFLPTDEAVCQRRWVINRCRAERRTVKRCQKVLLPVITLGIDLTSCKSAWDLCESISHSLLGWLNLYQRGFLHRNVSILSVYTMIERQTRNTRIRFQVNLDLTKTPDGLMDSMQSAIERLETDRYFKSLPGFEKDISKVTAELESLVSAELEGAVCAGYIHNGDFGQNWHKIFDQWGSDSIYKYEGPGTTQFMSDQIRLALEHGSDCIQTPMDDLESFFHVFVWAIVNNVHIERLLDFEENDYSEYLGRTREDRYRGQCGLLLRLDHTVPLMRLRDIARTWRDMNTELYSQWHRMDSIESELDAAGFFQQGGTERKDYWKWAWHLTAFSGVLRILKMIYSCKDELSSLPSFIDRS